MSVGLGNLIKVLILKTEQMSGNETMATLGIKCSLFLVTFRLPADKAEPIYLF